MRHTRPRRLVAALFVLASAALTADRIQAQDTIIPYEASFIVLPQVGGGFVAIGKSSLFGMIDSDLVRINRDGTLNVAVIDPGRSLSLTVFPDDTAQIAIETITKRRFRLMFGVVDAAEVIDLGA